MNGRSSPKNKKFSIFERKKKVDQWNRDLRDISLWGINTG